MKIAILGTGAVGATLGTRLVQGGHEVMMGSRTRENEKGMKWAEATGPGASVGTFAEAAAFGEVVVNCTKGSASLEALGLAGGENLEGKIILDISNPLDFSQGFPPFLTVCNTDSIGEQIQHAFPGAKVVKTLNTVTCAVMADPTLVSGDHNVFVGGNDPEAKEGAKGFLVDWFGWKRENIIDLGDITTSRGTEMWLPLWVRLYGAVGSPIFNLQINRAASARG